MASNLPEWAEREARGVFVATCAPLPTIKRTGHAIEAIAQALVAAEARGRDTAIGIMQSEIDNPTSHDPSICLDAAIRKLQENGNGPGGAG